MLGLELEVDLLAAGLAAGQAVVGVAVEGRTLEAVAARTKDNVDRAALEIAFGDVERRNLDRILLDRIERHRATRRRKTAVVEAEVVGELNAVDREPVEAAVIAGDFDRAAVGEIHCHEWVAAREVADVAVDRGDAFDLGAGKCGDRSGRFLALHAGAGDDDVLGSFLARKIDRNAEGFTGAQVQVRNRDGVKAVGANLD